MTTFTRLPSGSRASSMGFDFVDGAADRRGDPLRDVHDMVVMAEL